MLCRLRPPALRALSGFRIRVELLLNFGEKTPKMESNPNKEDLHMSVVWTPNLSVGVKQIDDQHKVWFEKANELFEAGKQHRAKEYIDTMLEFLDEYTKKHFRDEEAYMAQIRYPELDAQKKAHASFINELAKLKSEYSKSGGNIVVILNANQMVLNWLTNHISSMDKQIGDFVRAQNK